MQIPTSFGPIWWHSSGWVGQFQVRILSRIAGRHKPHPVWWLIRCGQSAYTTSRVWGCTKYSLYPLYNHPINHNRRVTNYKLDTPIVLDITSVHTKCSLIINWEFGCTISKGNQYINRFLSQNVKQTSRIGM